MYRKPFNSAYFNIEVVGSGDSRYFTGNRGIELPEKSDYSSYGGMWGSGGVTYTTKHLDMEIERFKQGAIADGVKPENVDITFTDKAKAFYEEIKGVRRHPRVNDDYVTRWLEGRAEELWRRDREDIEKIDFIRWYLEEKGCSEQEINQVLEKSRLEGYKRLYESCLRSREWYRNHGVSGYKQLMEWAEAIHRGNNPETSGFYGLRETIERFRGDLNRARKNDENIEFYAGKIGVFAPENDWIDEIVNTFKFTYESIDVDRVEHQQISLDFRRKSIGRTRSFLRKDNREDAVEKQKQIMIEVSCVKIGEYFIYIYSGDEKPIAGKHERDLKKLHGYIEQGADEQLNLKWNLEDVRYDRRTKLHLKALTHEYTRWELNRKEAKEVKDIAKIKCGETKRRKAENIALILGEEVKEEKREKRKKLPKAVEMSEIMKEAASHDEPPQDLEEMTPEFEVGDLVATVDKKIGKVLEVKQSTILKTPSFEYLLGIEGEKKRYHFSAIKGKAKALGQQPLLSKTPEQPSPAPPIFKYVPVRFKKNLPYGFRSADGKWIEGYKKGDIIELPGETAKTHVLKEYLEIVEAPPAAPPEERVKVGVPEGFYANRSLVDINRGHVKAGDEDKIPGELKCWSENCDNPLIVCGYPFYICENDHAYNHKTGEKWLWKPTDEVYHGLLNILQGRIEPAYQKLFYPQSRRTEHTEADNIALDLGNIGRSLYDKLNIQEDDPYNWGRDELRHHAGLRFTINIMHRALTEGRKVQFHHEGLRAGRLLNEEVERNADLFLNEYGEEGIQEMLHSVETVRRQQPKKTVKRTLDSFLTG